MLPPSKNIFCGGLILVLCTWLSGCKGWQLNAHPSVTLGEVLTTEQCGHDRIIFSDGLALSAGLGTFSEFSQTWWFRFACALAAALAAWLLYRIRMHHRIKQMNIRFEERLAERTRIAQDLHDTLLQGVLSAMMHLHVAAERLSDDSAAKPTLIRAQQLMDHVISEGRNAVQGLRSPDGETQKLEQAFSRIPQDLANQREIAYRVIVEGLSRPLRPVIRDEVYRIGREALVNAFLHAKAGNIEVQVEYTSAHLRIVVRDDGCGIEPRVLQAGREGHWGLSGMRERAERIGAKVRLWSRSNAGTEIELTVPRDVAYAPGPGKGRLIGLKRLNNGRRTKSMVEDHQAM